MKSGKGRFVVRIIENNRYNDKHFIYYTDAKIEYEKTCIYNPNKIELWQVGKNAKILESREDFTIK